MHHVVDDVATEAPDEHGEPQHLWQQQPQDAVEETDHQRGRHGREDQAGAVEGRLETERMVGQAAPSSPCLRPAHPCQALGKLIWEKPTLKPLP